MTWVEQGCAYVFDPAYFTEENTNVRGRGGKDSITYPHPCCSSFWQVAGMQPARTSGFTGTSQRREGRLPRSSEASHSSANHLCFNSFYMYHGCPCFPALYLFLATEITAGPEIGIHLASCFLLTNCSLQSQHQRQEARDLLILSERMSPEGGKAASTRSLFSQEKVTRCGVGA